MAVAASKESRNGGSGIEGVLERWRWHQRGPDMAVAVTAECEGNENWEVI
jgi:hypothetical protein